MTAETAPVIVDMEAQLAADASGQYRSQLQAELQAELSSVKRQLAAGLAPDDFAVANRLKDALESADVVVGRVWERQHSS